MNLPLSTSEHPPQAPTSLNFYSGGYFGSSLWLEWDGSRLYRKRQDSGGSDPRIDSWVCLLPPSAETWSDFRRLLDELKAWRWRRNWINREIMDGWQWNLVLVWGTQKWSGSGSNTSPRAFSRVERLLEALAKGRKAPGFPAGFSIRANQALGEVQFAWDGRRLEWQCCAYGKAGLVEGERSGIPSEAWKRFNRAFAKVRRAEPSEGITIEVCDSERRGSQSYSIVLERGGESSPPWLRVLGELARLAGVTLPFGMMAADH